MDSRQRISFTLHDLTKIALGAQTLTGCNTIILHSLLNLVLRKMNCQHEKVTISGFEATKLEELLKNSTQPVLLFDELNFNETFEEIDKLDQLENCLEHMEAKLKEHIEEISSTISEFKTNACSLPEPSPTAYGEVFSIMEPMERKICEQLLHGDAGKELITCIVQPSVKITKHIEQKVNALDEELNKVMERITEVTNKLDLLDELAKGLQSLENLSGKIHARLLRTLNEIQDILYSKVNRYEWALLLEYIHEKFEADWRLINVVQYEETCRRTSSILWDGDDTDDSKLNLPRNETSNFSIFDYDMTITKHPTLLERIQKIKPEDVKQRIQEFQKSRRSAKIYRRLTVPNI